ncbi:bifunctional indole-3-glycerol-phosphate synthase TrpC/phosphoribosylanthranilate isomerase TrpF [Buchnera aphidicola (Thelaxes californica)]|uniref:Multifunctional fusion protein n=1 Tax=Buchnera aphidicola (Thelaxes californica) TaxID=1315998 RepID=A0A4D6YL97_9GAMM|nr:bifunctional indole-3-glycerol-phosphate synthase TrpC/phosphoribosylanthranilate isomerase TrpF [Buchnera aphidicola]QCI26750.1 bifunctional indole-3-glycerol-phosphate synthase TrpC/phosphoribosylanthranilate isomerase TrpF [Buchnera aphidicola (Thelaxes californica)]
MNTTILEKIIHSKIDWIKNRKKIQPLNTFQNKIQISTENFKQTLTKKKPALILEIKKKSPSEGILQKKFNIHYISNIYKKYASAVSVLTDEEFFQGKFEYIPIVKSIVKKPILCKDFIIDPYQIYLSRFFQADAILLMLSVLNNEQFIHLYNLAKKLNMHVITEIHNKYELKRAILLKSEIIGINNRNLHDLSININNTFKLAPLIPKEIITISESGIKNYRTIKNIKNIVHGFLIGSSIMNKKNVEKGIHSIIFGKNKICGLTRVIDAKITKQVGAIFGGLIFIKSSKRKINISQSFNIIKSINLKYIGVFQNECIKKIIYITEKLNLYGVQLHGNENQEYINQLRKKLSSSIFIWKAFSIKNVIPTKKIENIQYTLYDNDQGGSGKQFNWLLLKKKEYNNILISGGININNCQQASTLGFSGLDINSGVEKKPGIKSEKKIKKIFEILNINYKNI